MVAHTGAECFTALGDTTYYIKETLSAATR